MAESCYIYIYITHMHIPLTLQHCVAAVLVEHGGAKGHVLKQSAHQHHLHAIVRFVAVKDGSGSGRLVDGLGDYR